MQTNYIICWIEINIFNKYDQWSFSFTKFLCSPVPDCCHSSPLFRASIATLFESSIFPLIFWGRRLGKGGNTAVYRPPSSAPLWRWRLRGLPNVSKFYYQILSCLKRGRTPKCLGRWWANRRMWRIPTAWKNYGSSSLQYSYWDIRNDDRIFKSIVYMCSNDSWKCELLAYIPYSASTIFYHNLFRLREEDRQLGRLWWS